MNQDHIKYMRMALEEAYQGRYQGYPPVGSVIVKEGRIVSLGRNTAEADLDVTAHAEVAALRRAGPELGGLDLSGCTLYSTGEPCIMCVGAIVSARVSRVVLGGHYDRYHGGYGDYSLEKALALVSREGVQVVRGVLREECEAMRWAYWAGLAQG